MGIFIVIAASTSYLLASKNNSKMKIQNVIYLSKKLINHPKSEFVHIITPPKELFKSKLVLSCKNKVGECPIWDDVEQKLLW